MDISNIQGLGGEVGHGDGGGDDGLSLSQATQKPTIQNSFSDQFKAVAQTPETEPSDLDKDVVSERITATELEETQAIIKTNQQTIKSSQTTAPTDAISLEGELADMLIASEGDIKANDKLTADKKAQLEADVKKSGTLIDNAVLSTSAQLNAKWIKKGSLGTDKTEETQSDEDVAEAEKADVTDATPAEGDNPALAQQQKLFSLNLRLSLKFLRDQKSFAQKFLPEIVVYDEATGCVDGKETLEMLGWQGVAGVKETYYSTLNNDHLNAIINTQDALRQARKDGHTVFSGRHPVFAKDTRVIAVEKLTGELTIINSLVDLRKLQIDTDAMLTHNIAE